MKLLSIAIPCYNSEKYMRKCIDSLLVGGEDVEILLIDDGSTDRTGEIADEYERNYPGIVRAVHKSNGGHGSGNNRTGSSAENLTVVVPPGTLVKDFETGEVLADLATLG